MGRSVELGELRDRTWVRLPDGVDPSWTAYWSGGRSRPDLLVVRTVRSFVKVAAAEAGRTTRR